MIFAATTVDIVTFVLGAVIVLAGALGVVLARNPVHSALSLIGTLFGIAVLFVAQEAHFLAAVQVIVYAGAIVVLFLFVIMLLGVDRTDDSVLDAPTPQRITAVVVGVAGFGAVIAMQVAGVLSATGAVQTDADRLASHPDGNVAQIAKSLFSDHLFAFEATSLLLVIAVVGAVVLARKPSADEQINPGGEDGS